MSQQIAEYDFIEFHALDDEFEEAVRKSTSLVFGR